LITSLLFLNHLGGFLFSENHKDGSGGEMALTVKHVALPNGEILAYRERPGTGPCILLLHGNMGSSALWEPFVEQFESACHLIAVDLRGYGESTYHHPIETMRDFSEGDP
jgi:alpha-beta hydrolase superfamily lysophospholipase